MSDKSKYVYNGQIHLAYIIYDNHSSMKSLKRFMQVYVFLTEIKYSFFELSSLLFSFCHAELIIHLST